MSGIFAVPALAEAAELDGGTGYGIALVEMSAMLAGLLGASIASAAGADETGLAIDHRPSVILLDVNMPEIDGLKVCRLLKENSCTRDIPVLFITVERRVEHLAQALLPRGRGHRGEEPHAAVVDAQDRRGRRCERQKALNRPRRR